MYLVELTTMGVKNKQYVKAIETRTPLLGSLAEAKPLSYACALRAKQALEKELTCGKATIERIPDVR